VYVTGIASSSKSVLKESIVKVYVAVVFGKAETISVFLGVYWLSEDSHIVWVESGI
jgi:hypothetical protein